MPIYLERWDDIDRSKGPLFYNEERLNREIDKLRAMFMSAREPHVIVDCPHCKAVIEDPIIRYTEAYVNAVRPRIEREKLMHAAMLDEIHDLEIALEEAEARHERT